MFSGFWCVTLYFSVRSLMALNFKMHDWWLLPISCSEKIFDQLDLSFFVNKLTESGNIANFFNRIFLERNQMKIAKSQVISFGGRNLVLTFEAL